jgi:cytochrome c-type biogenesis protein CcmH
VIRRLMLALVAALALAAPARAVNPDEMLADPALEARARTLSQELRCLVCQNQSIDDSNADLAHDLRVLVRDRLKAGDSDAQVLAYLQARYGAFVLLKPPVERATWLLWFGPPLLVAGALGTVTALALRRRSAAAPVPLDPAERARLTTLLGEDAR